MKKPASSRALWSAVALCAVQAVQAAPACTAMSSHTTWADCAGAFASYDAGDSRSGAGTLTFDTAFSQVAFDGDGDGAALASIDFATPGASSHQNSAPPGAVFATTSVPAIPEPHTNLLMLAGLAAIGFMATRHRRP